MDKMRMESVDLTQKNIEKIYELFPSVVTEKRAMDGQIKKAVNFELLKQILSGEVVEGDEAYEFTWVGKTEAMAEAGRPIRKTLRPCKEESKNWDNTENLYIEGDNLEVLKLLQESYMGKVNMIYIDPPYNTGKDFLYRDNFSQSKEEFEESIGILDDEGNRLFQNTETSGRFHSDWCSMLYPRLILSRRLLSEDGVIFISIDDNELYNLKKLCDEIFSSENYVNTISVRMKNIAGASGGGEDKRLKKNIEYILIYAKNYSSLAPFKNVYEYTPIGELVQTYREDGISWKYTTALTNSGEKEYIGSTLDGDGNEIKIFKRIGYEIKAINQIIRDENISESDAYNKYSHCIFQTAMPQSSIRPRVMSKVKELQVEGDLFSIEYIPRSGKNKGKIYEQFYKGENFRLFAWLRDVSEEVDGILCKKDLQGTLWDFAKETKNLTKEGSVSFPNGKKPLKMIRNLVDMQTHEDSVVLDFFSGSSTTAHAVMEANLTDVGNRKFIMVQLPELCDENSDSFKEGFKTICDIGKARIRNAGEKIIDDNTWEDNQQKLDMGFRVFKLDDSNMKDVYYSADQMTQDLLDQLESNIKEDRTDLDLLYGCLLEWGLPLSLPYSSENIGEVTIHIVNDGDLIACFDSAISEEVVREIARRHALRVVFRDSSFENTPAKINVEEIFKLIAPNTRVKVI